MGARGARLGGDLTALLESGVSIVAGTLDADGEPFATRGWGIDVVEDGPEPLVRVLLGAGELARLGPPAGEVGWPIAVTGADVTTLRGVQVKGTVERRGPASAADHERCARHCDRFFGAVMSVDRTERRLLERMVPVDLVACEVRVAEVYDQTPGPHAGGAVA